LGRKAMIDALRASLARLGVDSVDLYQARRALATRWQASVPGVLHTLHIAFPGARRFSSPWVAWGRALAGGSRPTELSY